MKKEKERVIKRDRMRGKEREKEQENIKNTNYYKVTIVAK